MKHLSPPQQQHSADSEDFGVGSHTLCPLHLTTILHLKSSSWLATGHEGKLNTRLWGTRCLSNLNFLLCTCYIICQITKLEHFQQPLHYKVEITGNPALAGPGCTCKLHKVVPISVPPLAASLSLHHPTHSLIENTVRPINGKGKIWIMNKQVQYFITRKKWRKRKDCGYAVSSQWVGGSPYMRWGWLTIKIDTNSQVILYAGW